MSDWTNESTGEVMRTLARGSSYYTLKKGGQQSLLGAFKTGAVQEYFDREKSRMPAMDVSDVAYDAFLINGWRRQHLAGKPGEVVRLRLINGGAASYFYVESSTGPMTVVAADGQRVEPFRIKRLLMGDGETYDALVTVPPTGTWEIRATSQDGSGYASAWIGEGDEHRAPDIPRPDLYRMDAMLMAAMDDTGKDANPERPEVPYSKLRSLSPTTKPKAEKLKEMQIRLNGDMQRYIWSFNGKTMAEEPMIHVGQGEVLRVELINDTMMHHPIHLHGFFFRVLGAQGAYSPLKHTVDVPPMGRRTVEFEANETGGWMFHCHLLYHMVGGMGRVLTVGQGHEMTAHDMGEHGKVPWHLIVDGSVQTHMTDGTLSLLHEKESLDARWQAGLLDSRDAPYEIDLTYNRYFNPNFNAFVGARLTDDRHDKNRGILGVNYRLPYLIQSSLGVDSEGGIRVGVGKEIQLTERAAIFGFIHYDTRTRIEWQAGVTYALSKQFSLIGQYHSDFGLGAGLAFHF